MMTSRQPHCRCPGRLARPLTRRDWLSQSAVGFGSLAVSALLAESVESSESTSAIDRRHSRPHFAPKVKNVIFLFMDGGVSHVDSFDPKPKLDELDAKPFLESKNPTANGNRQWLKSPWASKPYGQSGLPVSELFPHMAHGADALAVMRSM